MKMGKYEQENVNGVSISLYITPNKPNKVKSRCFSIEFVNNKKSTLRAKMRLILAALFNIIAIFYVEVHVIFIALTLVVLTALLLFWITHSVQSESILVVPNIGLQSTTKFVIGKKDLFISWNNIDDIIINEVIKMNRVLYFLTVLVKTREDETLIENMKLVPLFKATKPRLAMLERIYGELQDLLTENPSIAKASGDKG